jgi:hypothetical protein
MLQNNNIQLQNQLNNVNTQIASADSKIVDAQTQISSLQNDNSVLFGSININASIVTGGGSGSLMTGNNLNVTSALNQYYAMNYHMETQMDVAALAVTIAVAVAVSVATAGAGAALMTSVVMSTALATSAATAALIAVGTQYGMSAAMSGGQHGTEAIQSGDADTTTTRSQTVIASSLLFGGGLNASVGNNANIDTAKNGSTTTSIVTTHTDIEPDYGSLVKDAAITGAIAGGTVVAGEYIKAVKAKYNASADVKNGLKAPVSTGESNLMPGSPSDSKIGINVATDASGAPIRNAEGQLLQEGTQKITPSWSSNQNPVFKGANTLPGSPSFADFHDAASIGGVMNQVSIPFYYALSQYNAAGGVGAGLIARDVITNSTTSGNTTEKSILISN